VLTSRGGLTSHAAVVARGWGKCCVVGAGDVVVDEDNHLFRAGRAVVREGQVITLNGATGEVIMGAQPLVDPKLSDEFRRILTWAQERATTSVRANADTPADAKKAREFGAVGIGLVRTEHMFFGDERIPIVRDMIMAQDTQARRKAVDRLLPFQREDFIGIFRAMAPHPVTIRLLDPPLHEFLPKYKEVLEEYTRSRRASRRCRRPTRCSGTGAAASASRSPRSTTCRCARSWRPPVRWRERGSRSSPRS
jgi:pyruvate,orthophosphate dikinase